MKEDKTIENRKILPEPLLVNHLRQPLKERIALLFNLLAQTIMRDKVDIRQSIFLGHGDVAPVGNEVHGFRGAEFCRKDIFGSIKFEKRKA